MKTFIKKSLLLLFVFFASNQLFSQVTGLITQRGSSTTATSGSGTLTINKPTGVVAGDLLIANIVQNDATNNNLANVSIPTGWVLIDGRSIYEIDGSGGNPDKEWWGTLLYKVADGNEGANFSFTLDGDAEMAIGSIVAFSGVDVTNGPFDVATGSLNLTNAGTATASAISTATSNAAIVMFAQVANDRTYNDNWATTTPSSLTELYDNTTTSNDDASVGAAWAIKSSTGTTGNGTVTLSGSDRNAAILIALKPIRYSTAINTGNILQRGSSTTASSALSGSTRSLTINKPALVVSGDVLFLNLIQNETDNENGFADNTPNPSLTGWILVDGRQIESEGTGEDDNLWWGSLYYRVADGTEGTDFTFSLNTRTDMGIGTIVAFSGVDVTGGVKADGTAGGPFDVDPGTFSVTASSTTSLSALTITTVSSNTALIMFGQASNNRQFSSWTTATAGTLTQLYDDETEKGADATVAAAWKIVGSAGSVGDGSATISDDVRNAGILVALKPIIVNPYKYYNGSYGANQNNSNTTQVSVANRTVPTSASYFTSSNVKKVSIVFESSSNTISKIYADKDANGSLNVSSTTDFELVLDTDYFIENLSGNLKKVTINLPVITASGNLYKLFVASTASSVTFMDELNLAAAALPVTLSSFTAKPTTDNKVSLAWVTSTEQVNKGFRIERQAGSTTGKYEQIGFVGSKAKDGNSQNTLTYNFIDAAPKVGAASFYRLVQEDLDGKKTYSEVRVVKLNGQSVSMVFPNPSNGAVNISRTADGKKMNIQVIDQSGTIIRQLSNITDANYKLNIQKSGVYTIKMTYPETGEQSIQRIVVQK